MIGVKKSCLCERKKKWKDRMTSLSLREKKKILELASTIKSLDETQIKNLSKIVDNDSIQRMCCIIFSTCLKNRGTQIKKVLGTKF